jgi:hypothetical protein
MPAAVAVPAIVGGATSLAQGIMGHHAASTAAKQQSAAADKAMAVSRDVYGQQMAGMQPYANVGGAANGLMGRLMGAPAGARFASAGPAQAPGGMPQGGGAMVHLQAPDGSVQAVPQQFAQAFIAKGARPVSGPQGGGMPNPMARALGQAQ